MERKNPFGPEAKTAPSQRNPALERSPAREAVAVVEVAPPSSSSTPTNQARPAFSAVDLTEGFEGRPTDDTAGPSTPRPRLSLDAVPRVIADVAFIRVLPLGPRDAFLMAHLDGKSDLRTLVDVTGMTRLEVSMILEKLADLGVIEVA